MEQVMFRDWDTIEFPQFLRDLGFEDWSYHNDSCGRAQKPLKGFTEDAEAPCIVVWCEHEQLEEREYRDSDFPENARYHAYLHAVSGPGTDPHPIRLYAGDDPVACEAAIRALNGRVLASVDEGAALGSIVESGEGFMWVLFDKEDWRSYERPDGAIRYTFTGEYWGNDIANDAGRNSGGPLGHEGAVRYESGRGTERVLEGRRAGGGFLPAAKTWPSQKNGKTK